MVSPRDCPGGPVAKNPPCNAGDASLIPGQEDATSFRATKPAAQLLSQCTLGPRNHTREPVCPN